jgi:hypothetical protein
MANHERDAKREAFWRGVFQRSAASGLTIRAFCEREQLTESAFFAWRRTIAERDAEAKSPAGLATWRTVAAAGLFARAAGGEQRS